MLGSVGSRDSGRGGLVAKSPKIGRGEFKGVWLATLAARGGVLEIRKIGARVSVWQC